MKKTNILTLMLMLTVSVAFGQTFNYSLNYGSIKFGNSATGQHQFNGLATFVNGINVPLRSLSDSSDNAASTKWTKQGFIKANSITPQLATINIDGDVNISSDFRGSKLTLINDLNNPWAINGGRYSAKGDDFIIYRNLTGTGNAIFGVTDQGIKLYNRPLLDGSPKQVLTRDSLTGEIKYTPYTASGGSGTYELLANKATTLTSPNNTTYPTTLAVSNALMPISATNVSNQSQTNWLGDSFFDYSNGWVSPVNQFKTLTGFKANNLGVTGTTTTQFKARFDALLAVNPSYLQQSWVFGSFRNDIAQGGYNTGTANTIKANYAAMITSLGHTRFLIYQMIPNNSETNGSAGRTWLNQINSDLASLYPNNYVPTIAALQAAGNGSTTDNNAIAQGLIPPSLQFDTNHLNTAGYLVFAQQGVNKIGQLQPDASKILTLASVGGILQQGQQSFDLGTGGEYRIGGFPAIKIYDQNSSQFLNTIVVGNGGKALTHTTGLTGQSNTFVGMQAADKTTTGAGNMAMGSYALYNNLTGNNNVAIGESAGLANLATGNTFLGKDAGRNNSTGANNLFLATGSGLGISTGGNNLVAGLNSAFTSNGTGNVAFGVSALQNNTGASNNNVAIGLEALKGGTGIASGNVGIGRQTGITVTGSNNTFIGDQAGDNVTTGSKNIVIGQGADIQTATASNQMNIGNLLWGTGMSATGTATAGALGVLNINPQVALDVTGGARVSVAPTTATDVVRLTEISAGQTIGARATGTTLNDVLTANNTSTLGANFGNDVSLVKTGDVSLTVASNTSGDPYIYLNANGSDGSSIKYDRATSQIRISNSGAVNALNIMSNGNIAISKLTADVKLDVNGSARASSNDGNANTLVRNTDLANYALKTPVFQTSGTSATLVSSGRYIPQNASLTIFTLPTTAAVGDVIFINGKGAGGWRIAQNTGQIIHGATDTTTGSSGYVGSTARYNSVAIVCVTANTEWIIQSSQGSLTIN